MRRSFLPPHDSLGNDLTPHDTHAFVPVSTSWTPPQHAGVRASAIAFFAATKREKRTWILPAQDETSSTHVGVRTCGSCRTNRECSQHFQRNECRKDSVRTRTMCKDWTEEKDSSYRSHPELPDEISSQRECNAWRLSVQSASGYSLGTSDVDSVLEYAPALHDEQIRLEFCTCVSFFFNDLWWMYQHLLQSFRNSSTSVWNMHVSKDKYKITQHSMSVRDRQRKRFLDFKERERESRDFHFRRRIVFFWERE